MTHTEMARLVASKLSREELIELATMLDEDADDDFNTAIQAETAKVAPELYNYSTTVDGGLPPKKYEFVVEQREGPTENGPWGEPTFIVRNASGDTRDQDWTEPKRHKRKGVVYWEQRRVIRRPA